MKVRQTIPIFVPPLLRGESLEWWAWRGGMVALAREIVFVSDNPSFFRKNRARLADEAHRLLRRHHELSARSAP